MPTRTLVAVSLLAFALFHAPLLAGQTQNAAKPSPQTITNPIVGAGAQYEIDRADGSKTNFEMAVVGKEPVDGKDAYWFETTMDGLTGDITMKVLLVFDGATSHAAKMVMQLPGRPPVEIPVSAMGGVADPNVQMPGAPTLPAAQDLRDQADDLGGESITVPAGKFTCEHYKAKDGSSEVWLTQNAPPDGLVKTQTKDQTTVLTKVLTNVQDKITGPVEQFNPNASDPDPQQPPR